MMMANDLHRGNIALWKGNLVVIDFGYHIAVPEYRDYDRLEIITNHWGKVAV
jgi:predicted unusual protein kinase regulating ubiquinone biosynthesis (AarF/ABC1/UbiB family)